MKKDKAIRNAKNFDELLNIQYGKIGTKKRDVFEERAQYFVISETSEIDLIWQAPAKSK